MNKHEFIEALSKKLNVSEEEGIKINSILEDHFIFSKKNKEKIVNALVDKLNISEEKANKIYDTAMELINTNIKDKILHPFKK